MQGEKKTFDSAAVWGGSGGKVRLVSPTNMQLNTPFPDDILVLKESG